MKCAMSDEKTCRLPETNWWRILNLLTEELGVWGKDGYDWNVIRGMILDIEEQTGIKPRRAEVVEQCGMCGRFVPKGQGCPVHDPQWGEEVVYTQDFENHGKVGRID